MNQLADVPDFKEEPSSTDAHLNKAVKVIQQATDQNILKHEIVSFLQERGVDQNTIDTAFNQSNTETTINMPEKTNTQNYFEWKDVNVTIQGKQILHNIRGRVKSGQLLAILGGSGAGKSTLLNSISGRLLSKTPSPFFNTLACKEEWKDLGVQVTGSVAYGGKEYVLGNNDSIKFISAYVMQHDIMCGTATGLEALKFSSRLRSTGTDEEREQVIEHVLQSLKLTECQHTRVGNEAVRGMSGGEKKRTSVGVELVNQPELIFLDECTSGLDSFTALKTLEILRSLTSKENKLVVTTIHQPSSEIFNMIDILVLLAKGHVVFYGPADQVLDYFQSIGYECPKYSNIADFVVNQVQENSDFFIEQWKKHESQYIEMNFEDYGVLRPEKKQTASFSTQFIEVLKREVQILQRDPRPSKMRLAQTFLFALFVGLLYFDLPYTPEGMRDRFGAVFFMTVNSSMTGLTSTIIVFPEQRLLFERERDGNMYFTTTWLLAKFLVGIPEQAVFTMIYQLIVYWMVGFDAPFWALYFTVLLCVICTGSFGMIIGCFAKNAGEAMQLMPMAFIPFLLFTNFLVSLEQIPVWIRWLQWVDPFKFMVDALSIMEFQGQLHDYQCVAHANGAEVCDYLYNGNLYLEQIGAGYADVYGLRNFVDTYWQSVYVDWALLLILVFGFRFITWFVLVNRNGW